MASALSTGSTAISEVRPQLAIEPDEGWLFLTTSHGDAFTPQGMTTRVRDWVRASGVRKPGGCHLFGHTMATVMLENCADIRFIQQMLGHTNLSTTEIYTQVSVRKLQEVHRHTSPTAKLEPEAVPASKSSLAAASDDAVVEDDDPL